jgi:histidinol-phosphate aminotransferase
VADPLSALVREEIAGLAPYKIPHPQGIKIKLDANEMSWALPRPIADNLSRYLSVVDLNRYPDADCSELRSVVASDLGVDGESLVFGNGSDELIFMLCATFARPRPGEDRARVLYPVPTFSVFRTAALGAGMQPVEVELGPRFRFDAAAAEAAIAEHRPNLVFFARPNNPTGTLWPSAVIATLARNHPDVLIVSDEAYAEYSGDSMRAMTAAIPNLVVLRTLSKMGLAALRIGFLHGQPTVVRELEKIRAPYNVGALNQCAAVYILRNHLGFLRERCAQIVSERERVSRELVRIGVQDVYDSQANLVLFRVGNASKVWKKLCRKGVLIRNFEGAPDPLGSCLRVTIGTPEENDLFLSTLGKAL